MPRPRFDRLAPAKQQRILEAAAREFAAWGYQDASLNRILEVAQISKGAAYYYFDGKADLFATTVSHYAATMLATADLATAAGAAEEFWPALADFYVQQFRHYYDRPWAFGVVKAASRLTAEELAALPALAPLFEEAAHSIERVIRRGQALDVIRDDLPQTLLSGLLVAVDTASDQWLLEHWDELTPAAIEQIARQIIEGLARLLAPAPSLENDD